MDYYTVNEVSDLLSVNEETVRRWIRSGKIEAERGSGRKASKISSESLKKFLEKNKGLITEDVISVLGGCATAALGASLLLGPIGMISATALGLSWLEILKSKDKTKKEIEIELLQKEMELEQLAAKLKIEIASKKNELKLVEVQLDRIRGIMK